jgi:iron-sulfur cluster repair protein YtfE (RIC family)
MSRNANGRRDDSADVVELLLACHERIRRFAGLALKLARAKGTPEHEIRDVARAIGRYFDEALPLHVADEEETVLPRLKHGSVELAAALERMVDEHRDHQHDLARLVLVCSDLADDPQRLEERRAELEALAARLSADFERHLAAEEHDVFPGIESKLPFDVRKAMVAELRARRAERDPGGVHAHQ